MVVIADCHKIKFYIHRMLLHYCLSGPLYDSFENTSVHCVTTFIALQYLSIASTNSPSAAFSASSRSLFTNSMLMLFEMFQQNTSKLPSFFFIACCIIFKGEKSIEQNEKQTKRIYLFLYSKSMADFEAFC